MQIHIHPDKRIILREDDEVLFNGTFQETAEVLGAPIPSLPEGVREIQFDTESQILVGFGKTGQLDSVNYDMSVFADNIELLQVAGEEKKKALEEAAISPEPPEPVPDHMPVVQEPEGGNAT